MRHPFIVGQVVAGLVLYALTAAWDGLAANLVLLSFAGALVGCLITRRRPGFHAPWPKLLAIAPLTNFAMLMALAELVTQIPCWLGAGGNCSLWIAKIALAIVAVCLLLPAGGLLWRWWSRSRPG
jgi:hypothetical protein